MSSFPPSVFIVGSQKCGTSSLAKLLDQNSEVCLSTPKEPNYYTGNYEKGLNWYRNCFEDAGKVLVDASTTYTMCPLSDKALNLKKGRAQQTGVPRRIREDSPGARIIYIIRDPVNRLYSNYWHNMKYGYEKLPLRDAIARDPQYIHMGEYFGQMAKYLEHFSKQQILILRFEDFVRDQQRVVNKCEDFIGVSISKTENPVRENTSQQYTGIGKYLVNNPLLKNMDKIIPSAAKRAVKKWITTEIPPLTPEAARKLRTHFVEDQKKLQSYFGMGYLSEWAAR